MYQLNSLFLTSKFFRLVKIYAKGLPLFQYKPFKKHPSHGILKIDKLQIDLLLKKKINLNLLPSQS
jgi:hypothetical protein